MKNINKLYRDIVGSIVNGETLYGVYIKVDLLEYIDDSTTETASVREVLIGEYTKEVADDLIAIANQIK